MGGTDGFSKLVVVKRLLQNLVGDKEFVEMFLDEARINARLSHSNIVQVLDLGEADGQYFMTMEYVTGLSVAQVGRMAAQRLGEVPQGVACGMVAQACAGLHSAHETTLPDGSNMGIIHRDVSPQNLILTYEGFVKVLDFGIAKAEGRATQTKAGTVKGKFAYMSPEQCTGEGIDRRTDIFALGIILFELCTSRRLFKRPNAFETYEAIIKGDIPDPASVSPAVTPQISAVIMKALARKKEDRFPTAEAMQEALEHAMRKSQIRGKSTDLARFLEQHFADQIKEQEDLIRRIESGAFNQPDAEQSEASHLAENYAALVEEELEEIDDGPTETGEKGQAPGKAAPPAPPVRGINQENAPIANLPVSMALPIIDRNQVIADMLAGKQPNLFGDQRPQQPTPTPTPSPSGRPGTGQGLAPMQKTPVPTASGQQGFVPSPTAGSVAAGQAGAAGSGAPMGFLDRMANLPLVYLILIGIVLALVGAGVTALIVF
jgi:serine/threonine-protein kinase